MTPPPPLAVLIGGCLGGAARMAIDATWEGASLPWEILAVNVLGSLILGFVAAHAAVRGVRWWTPMVTTGAMGGFTTFSAVAALPWTADAPAWVSLAALVGTTVAAVAAAGIGWRLGHGYATAPELPETDL
ncbi:CrcB family protein [Demequina sp. NBRC 110056]|uniref:fluoride efflux transporter FluC n=1 Tax=Demequina sp. NBRC 110056 TaxID=1570345 RepID=UPI000A068D49|nr:CrcB family protein [Demequina sp. NBRC 110056]